MKRWTPDELGMIPDANGEYIRYEDHCDAMKRIAGAPVAQGLTGEQEEGWMKPQWCSICKGATCLPGMHATEPTVLGAKRVPSIAACIIGASAVANKIDGYEAAEVFKAMLQADAVPSRPVPAASPAALKVPEGYRLVRSELRDEMVRMAASPASLTVAVKALEQLASVPGCGCDFPCRCGGAEWTRAELEGRMDIAAEALAEIERMSATPPAA